MFNFYPYTENREKFCKTLMDSFPFIKKETIGKSLVGRNLEAFTIGNKSKRIIMVGGVHGSEFLTINLLFNFLWDLCLSYRDGSDVAGIKMKRYLNRRGVTFLPCLNPDGTDINLLGFSSSKGYAKLVEYICPHTCNWQANARGVDLNHNFPANWEVIHHQEEVLGICSPSNTRYGGKSPSSEPETISIMNYIISNDFGRCYAFHSQGREIYYDFGEHTPKDSPTIARLLCKTSGYTLSTPPEIADGGGLKDWFIERFHRPGFTFEIGKGVNPLPLSDLEEEYKILQKTLCLAVIV